MGEPCDAKEIEISMKRKHLTKDEKIIFLFDVDAEMGTPWDQESTSLPRYVVVKEYIEMLIRRKSNFTSAHRFSLAVFNDASAIRLIQNFTSDVEEMLAAFGRIDSEMIPSQQVSFPSEQRSIDLSELVNRLSFIFPPEEALIEEHYLTRCILIYGRSYSPPTITNEIELIRNPKFYIDALYIHVRHSEEGTCCQSAFDTLCLLQEYMNESGKVSFVMETIQSNFRLLNHCSSLIAHSAQRLDQSDFFDKVDISDEYLDELRAYSCK